MQTLFGTSDAVLSECGTYRYRLSRTWDESLRPACWVLLNPSTADATEDDATIRRCVGFARAWGCGGIVVVNLFAYRATDPRELKRHPDPVGPENDRHIRATVEQCHPVVAGWGVHGVMLNRAEKVERLLRDVGVPLWCLGTTKDGHPRHPLYLASAAVLVEYRP